VIPNEQLERTPVRVIEGERPASRPGHVLGRDLIPTTGPFTCSG
jgi:hypothetical protein